MANLSLRNQKLSRRPAPRRPGSTWVVVLMVVAALLVVGGLVSYFLLAKRGNSDANPILHEVKRGQFNHVVVEQGEVESSKNIELRCEVKARTGSGPSTSIIDVVPEGTVVKEGDVLVKLDSSVLEQERDRQEIAVNNSEALMVQAQNMYEAAMISRDEYLSGTYVQTEQTILSEIFVAEENQRRSRQHAKYSERLAAKGYVTALQLEGDVFAVEKAKNELDVAHTKLKVLQELTKKKTLKQFDSDIVTAKSKWDTEKSSNAIEVRKLAEIESQIAKCIIKAPSDGQVVYANIVSSRGGSNEFVVEPGALVREQQAIIRLPDPNFMQVKAKVSESRVTLVKAGMPVVIKCEALEGVSLAGEVIRVNQYAEPQGWGSSPVKVYSTFIRIVDAPEEIRTGLTAQVSIQIERRDNVLQIPIQTVVEHGPKTYCLVLTPDKRIEPREVNIGASNEKFVLLGETPKADASLRNVADDGIKFGVAENEQVVMNPRDYLHRVKLPEPPTISPEQAEALKKAQDAAKEKKPAAEGTSTPGSVPSGAGTPTAGGAEGGRRGGGRGTPAEFFARLDKDSDGKVLIAELPSFLADQAGSADTNADGSLDRIEFMALMAKLPPRGAGPPGGGPPGGGGGP